MLDIKEAFAPLTLEMMRELTDNPTLDEVTCDKLKAGALLLTVMAQQMEPQEDYDLSEENRKVFEERCRFYSDVLGDLLYKHLTIQGHLCSHSNGSQPRTLLFELAQAKGKGKVEAVLRASTYTGLMTTGVKQVVGDVKAVLDLVEGEEAVALWICPLPEPLGRVLGCSNPVATYLVDHTGFEMVGVTSVDGSLVWHPLNSEARGLALLCAANLNQTTYLRRHFRMFIRHAKTATVELLSRPNARGESPYSVQEAQTIAGLVWDGDSMLETSVDRHMTLLTQLGATNLDFAIRMISDLTVRMLDHTKQAAAEREAEVARKTKRLRSDLERNEMLLNGVKARAARLEGEVQQLREQLNSASVAAPAAKSAGGAVVSSPADWSMAEELRKLTGLQAA